MGKKKKKEKKKKTFTFDGKSRGPLSESGTQCMVVTYIAFSNKKNTQSYLLN